MTIYDIRVIAKNMDIEPKKMNKADLIKSTTKKRGIRHILKQQMITVIK